MTPHEEYAALGRAMDLLAAEFTKTGDARIVKDITEISVRRAELERIMESASPSE